jgi:hypothetical protein
LVLGALALLLLNIPRFLADASKERAKKAPLGTTLLELPLCAGGLYRLLIGWGVL